MGSETPGPELLLEYEYEGETPVSVAVVQAIATVEEIDPTTVSTRFDRTLFDCIDPSGFNALVTEGVDAIDLVVEFTVFGYRVQVEDETRILIYEHTDQACG